MNEMEMSGQNDNEMRKSMVPSDIDEFTIFFVDEVILSFPMWDSRICFTNNLIEFLTKTV